MATPQVQSPSVVSTMTADYEQQQQKAATAEANMPQAGRLLDFYANKCILITGATGFIGKVLLAKLLKSLTTVGKVYVLMRAKKGSSPSQRLDKMLNQEPFKSTLGATPGLESRIVSLEGDMQLDSLGLSGDQLDEVLEKVDIFFNIAASVQFDSPLKANKRDNYNGAQNMLELAVQMRRLVSLVHVSTFFSNCHLPHIEEKVLPLKTDCTKLAEIIDWMPDELAESDDGRRALFESRPNAYIITKAMAENLVAKYAKRLPISIVRPSIVVPSVTEPHPGWVDSINGPMGLGALASVGILRYVDWNYFKPGDIIPVDTCAHVMLAAAERTVRLATNVARHNNKHEHDDNKNQETHMRVYNLTTTTTAMQTWGMVFEKLRIASMQAPPMKMLRIPIKPPRITRANPITLKLSRISELVFAYLIDLLLFVCNQKPVLVRITAKLHRAYVILLPFMTKAHTSNVDNFVDAYKELHPDDKQTFPFDLTQIDWDKYYFDAYMGARRRILQEDDSNIPAARKKMVVLYIVEGVFKLMMVLLVLYTSKRLFIG